MLEVLNDPRIRMRWRFFRYYLSPPKFDETGTPLVLRVRLQPFWRKMRVAAALFIVALIAGSAIDVKRNGWADVGEQAPELFLALVAGGAFCAAITLGGKRLKATFGPAEVQVDEPGVGTWNEPLSAYSGVAWLFYKSESYYRLFQMGGKSEYRRLANPDVTYYHWIELLHPDRAKSLVLAVGPAEAGMRERLDRFSRALHQPIAATRVEDDGSGNVLPVELPLSQ